MADTIGGVISIIWALSLLIMPICKLINKETIFNMSYFKYSILVVIPISFIQVVYLGFLANYHMYNFK